jgi:hypothetical protein
MSGDDREHHDITRNAHRTQMSEEIMYHATVPSGSNVNTRKSNNDEKMINYGARNSDVVGTGAKGKGGRVFIGRADQIGHNVGGEVRPKGVAERGKDAVEMSDLGWGGGHNVPKGGRGGDREESRKKSGVRRELGVNEAGRERYGWRNAEVEVRQIIHYY